MATELYLIRHAIAADRGEAYPDDSKRPLTGRGIARLRREVDGLKSLGVTFDQILTSPLARAKQTAELLAEHLPGRPPVSTTDALAPAGTTAAVVQELARHARRSRVAVVGHEPNLGELAARLVGSKVPIEFKKGAVLRVDLESLSPLQAGQLRWFLTPRMLRRLGR
jgi:phosphohistidine phosphatase